MIRDKVFISYSHRDDKWRKKLLVHLKPHIEEGLIIWSDKDIQPGQQWSSEIELSLCTASVAVLLMSAEFLASDFIQDNEVPRFLDSAKLGQIIILPVLISDCSWTQKKIGIYQSPVNPNKPLRALEGNKLEKALVKIASAIQTAWEKQRCSYSQSFPEEEPSRAALADFRKLADRYTQASADLVEACFRRAVCECFGEASLEAWFPQLSTLKSLGWPQLNNFFDDTNRPAPALVEALERHLNAPAPQPLTPLDSTSYIALVLQRAASRAGVTRYFTWSVFFAKDGTVGYQDPIVLEGLEQSRNQVVFDEPQKDETSIATILAQLLAWAKRNTSLSVLEIFAPTELLDAPWSELVVEERPGLTITLLKAIPFLLRPVDRLEEKCNLNRPRLKSKLMKLRDGKAKWCAGPLAADPDHLYAALVEEDHDAGVKRLQPFPLDQTKRDAWFDALIESMAPIAIWCRHGTKSSEDERTTHLESYAMLTGHRHGDPICATCVHYDQLARQRKMLISNPVSGEIVFMLDHWERTPKITPQDRGATRAVSPSP